MKNSNDLHGTLVLVDPNLSDDPAKGQGQIGVVKYDRQQSQEVYVGFENGAEAIYRPEQLLKFKGPEAIRQTLIAEKQTLPVNDFKALYKILTLLDRGTPKATWDALAVAREHSGAISRAMEPAREPMRDTSAALER